MDIKVVNKLIEDLKDNLGDGLLFSDISSFKIGTSIASYNASPKTATLVNKFSKYIKDMVVKIGLGTGIDYYAAETASNLTMYVIMSGDLCWSIMVDNAQVPIGMMMVGVLPDSRENLANAAK